MIPRYAIYYAPKPDDPLSVAAGHWLGRDAFTGAMLDRPNLPEFAEIDVSALTSDPRHYGFHATLKAPFELSSDQTEEALMAALEDFCGGCQPFSADIAPQSISHFIAFRLMGSTDDMQALHEACVRAFEPFRAPLRDADIARRRKAALSPLQDERLLAFGYPYIFEDFRFHMTLTGAVRDEALRYRLVTALQAHFEAVTGPHTFWGLSLFKQNSRDEGFVIVKQAAFLGV
jgi:putative phosphonate metabolism protein